MPPGAGASAQPLPHNPRKQRENPAAARSGERFREGKWRRDRDSNPGDGFPPTRVPGVRLRPLGHLSVGMCYRIRPGMRKAGTGCRPSALDRRADGRCGRRFDGAGIIRSCQRAGCRSCSPGRADGVRNPAPGILRARGVPSTGGLDVVAGLRATPCPFSPAVQRSAFSHARAARPAANDGGATAPSAHVATAARSRRRGACGRRRPSCAAWPDTARPSALWCAPGTIRAEAGVDASAT